MYFTALREHFSKFIFKAGQEVSVAFFHAPIETLETSLFPERGDSVPEEGDPGL